MAGWKRRGRRPEGSSEENREKEELQNDNNGGGLSGYEQSRDQRILENKQRLEKLGILELSRKLKSGSVKRPKRDPSLKKCDSLLHSHPQRRSSRLETMTRVSYTEIRTPKNKESTKNVKIHIKRGSKPEIYTEEHEKLLGDCKEAWTLFKDGYDQEGQRIYDPFEGKSCHQCRQKTLGCRTKCSKCKLIQGQFCGDCLYMRYGENVMEVNEDESWICPVCRGICNCSRCRRINGWEPTGSIYRKVVRLGFKSVAHYLIQTRGPKTNEEEQEQEHEQEQPVLDNLISVSETEHEAEEGEEEEEDEDEKTEAEAFDD